MKQIMKLNSNKSRIYNYLFTHVNNSPIILFRILFGFVMSMEFFGAQMTGWITEVFIETKMNFTFIGFEFLEHLHGPMMYWYYAVMGICAILVALGLFYRPASIIMAIMWTMVYFSQKNHYNNHYYLMVLLSWLMTIVPANKRASFDVKFGFVKAANTCARWYFTLFIAQIWIMYTFAAIAKMNNDWLHAMPIKMWFARKSDTPYVGWLYGQEWFSWFVAYGGLLFDLLITPALLWKKTRKLAVGMMFFFHFFNSATFGIGSFPYMAMSLAVLFYPGAAFDDLLRKNKNATDNINPTAHKYKGLITIFLITYIFWQMIVPIRHHFIKGDVSWTEEGHRMAWRMMLRSKSGNAYYIVKDKITGQIWNVQPGEYLLRFQVSDVAHHPDMIWQFAQHLKKEYKKKGHDVSVYGVCNCSLNGGPYKPIVDKNVDLAAERWYYYKHHTWLTARPNEE